MNYISKQGELNNYWRTVEKENDKARRKAYRHQVERMRIEMGSAYDSAEDDKYKA